VLYNIGQVYYQLHDYARAVQTLERYLDEGKGRVSPKRRRSVEEDLAKLRPRVAELEIVVDVMGAEILVDDVAVGDSPLGEPVAVSAGRRKVTVVAPGREPVSKLVDVAGRERATVHIDIGLGAAPPPPERDASPEGEADAEQAEESEGSRHLWVGWVVTGALAAGAVVTGSLALSASSDLEDARGRPTTRDELDEQSDQTLGLAIATDVLAGGAIVAGTVTLVFALVGGGDDEEPATEPTDEVSLRWMVGPTGVGLAGQFW